MSSDVWISLTLPNEVTADTPEPTIVEGKVKHVVPAGGPDYFRFLRYRTNADL